MAQPTLFERWIGRQAARVIRREKPTVIAVTGSVGKSSTKTAIGALLQAHLPGSRTRVSAKNYNNELGVPFTIMGLKAPGRSPFKWLSVIWNAWAYGAGLKKAGVRTFVLEMGADKPGDLGHLVAIAPPDVSVVVAVTSEDHSLIPVHAANYPSVDALAEEKATLVRRVKSGGAVVLNADDPKVFAMRHLMHEHAVTFGETDAVDVRLVSSRIVCEDRPVGAVPVGLEVTLESLNRMRTLYIPGVFGRSIAYALSAAVATGVALDVGTEAVLDLPEHFHPLPGRTRIIPGIKHTTLFDDSYNASPASTLSALRDLAALGLKPGQRKAACIGEMRELGEQAAAMHRRIGAEAARLKIDLLVACGPFASAMQEGALANGMTEEQVRVFDDTPEAGLFLQNWIKPGDVVLAKASEGALQSKGVRMERVIKELMAEPLRAGELLVRQEEAWKRR